MADKRSQVILKRYDRIMAAINHPEYIKDLKEFEKLKSQNDRHERSSEIYKKWGVRIEAIDHVDELDRDQPDCIKVVQNMKQEPISKYALLTNGSITKEGIEGERLYLQVDIYDTKSNLKKEFSRIIDEYKKIIPENQSRNKSTTIDPWKVWKMYHEENKNLLEITRELFNVQGIPNYGLDEKLYKQVQRAYKKAEEMIQSVTPHLSGKLDE